MPRSASSFWCLKYNSEGNLPLRCFHSDMVARETPKNSAALAGPPSSLTSCAGLNHEKKLQEGVYSVNRMFIVVCIEPPEGAKHDVH